MRPLQTLWATYVFVKTVNFSFLINQISCMFTKAFWSHQYSPVSKSNLKYLQRITELLRKLFLRLFQKAFFLENLHFRSIFRAFVTSKKQYKEKGFFRKIALWKCLRKSFLSTFLILCRYLECSLDPELSSDDFTMVLWTYGRFNVSRTRSWRFWKKYTWPETSVKPSKSHNFNTFLTSVVSKTFSIHAKIMFCVSKMLS